MVSCLLEFNFLKEHLLHTYCYTFFLLCFLFFLPIEKICFQLFSAAFVLEIIFSKDITFGSLIFQKSAFFLILRLLCFFLATSQFHVSLPLSNKLPSLSEFSTSSSLFEIRSSSLASSSDFLYFLRQKLIPVYSTSWMNWWGPASSLFPPTGSWGISTQ